MLNGYVLKYASLAQIAPECWLLCSIAVLLILATCSFRWVFLVTQLALAVTVALLAGWFLHASALGAVSLFSGHYLIDALSQCFKIIIVVLLAAALASARQYNVCQRIMTGEFCVLALLMGLGAMVVVSSASFLALYLGLELLSLSSVVLIGLHKAGDRSIESAIKYFVISALASLILLYGLSLIYGVTGSFALNQCAQVIAQSGSGHGLLLVGLFLLLVGLLTKLGVAPFHVWVPDAYQGAPASVLPLLAVLPKCAISVLLLRISTVLWPAMIHDWQWVWIVVGCASIIWGNLAALLQKELKRLLAYSSIAHMGFLVLGLASGSVLGQTSLLFYVISYALMSLAAFGLLNYLPDQLHQQVPIDQLAGLAKRQPRVAFCMMLILFSLAGIPPLLGFMAKLSVLQALIAAGQVPAAICAILMAVIGAAYYIRVIKVMYFDHPAQGSDWTVGVKPAWAIQLGTGVVLLLGCLPNVLFALVHFVW